MLGEIEQLVQFVHRLATKKESEDVPLAYSRAIIRIGVVLVAKIGTILADGIDPYLQAAQIDIDREEVNALYLIVWEKPHLRQARTTAWFRYRTTVATLETAIGKLPGVTFQFSSPYSYTDSYGSRQRGTMSRFIVDQAKRSRTKPAGRNL
jgi:hypothetical protein